MKKLLAFFLLPLLAMAAPTQPITNGVVPSGGTLTIQNGGALNGAAGSTITAVTQSAGDNSTKVATTAYADAAASVTASSTTTFTNKRITRRVTAPTVSANTLTLAGDTTDKAAVASAITAALTMAVPSGTPNDGDTMELELLSNATSPGWGLTWTTTSGGFAASADISLPPALSGNNLRDAFKFEWFASKSRWVITGRVMGF